MAGWPIEGAGERRLRAMRFYSLLFLVAAIAAAVLGFWIVVGTLALIAKLLFLVFLVLFAWALLRSRRPRP